MVAIEEDRAVVRGWAIGLPGVRGVGGETDWTIAFIDGHEGDVGVGNCTEEAEMRCNSTWRRGLHRDWSQTFRRGRRGWGKGCVIAQKIRTRIDP